MTYEANETSIESGAPVYLYEFRRGASVWRFGSDLADVLSGGHTWAPSPVTHSEVSQTGQVERDALKLTFPEGDAFAEPFVSRSPPEEVTTVTLYRGHRGEDDFRVIWKGRVGKPLASGASIELSCEPTWTSQRRIGLLTPYQRSCPYALYYGKCGLNKDDFAVTAELVAVAGSTIQVSASSAVVGDDFSGGFVASMVTGDLRMIREDQGAGVLVLSRPLDALADDLAAMSEPRVLLYPGCNRTPERCVEFGNLDNYGGFLWIPTNGKNPFGGSSIA